MTEPEEHEELDDRVHDDIPEGKDRPWGVLYTLVVVALVLQILVFTWFTLHFK
ncbi:MAG: hypothetical protein MI748_10495 [Opitutales bacterium]|nr:hypothetical protein [Opitutales bacterium]